MMRNVPTLFAALAAAALLSACTVTFTPGEADVRVRGGLVATVGSDLIMGPPWHEHLNGA